MRLRSILCLFLALLCCLLEVRFVHSDGESFATAPDVSWSQPRDLALNNLGPADPTEINRRYDCTPLTYRFIDDPTKAMQTGCFVETAFGRIDPDKSVVIMNGTDEAEFIKDDGRKPVMTALPHSGSVMTFGGFPTVGSYLYLYSNFYSALESSGSPLYGGRFKEISRSPDFVVRDSNNQPLIVNPVAFSASARSQWFVTETPNKSLVRVSMADFSILPFGPSLGAAGQPAYAQAAAMAITSDGRYAAVAHGFSKTLRIYDLKHCGTSTNDDPLASRNCQSHDYWNYLEDQVSGTITNIGALRFNSDGILSMNIKTDASYETYLLSPEGTITSLIPYLGLGDSYASGQGAFNYLSGTDTAINKCHVSTHAYPLLLSRSLFSGRGQSVACSGAQTRDISSTSSRYTGQSSAQISTQSHESTGNEVNILHDFTPGLLAQQRFVTSYQPGVITLQIGGNDAGFGTILLRCLSPLTSVWPPVVNNNSCYQSREDRLEIVDAVNRMYPKLTALYKQLRQQSPQSKIYIIGYPYILSSKAQCRANVRLTLAEITFTRELTVYLNSVIQKAAQASGVRYVDVTDALAGHELCSGASGTLAVNGITAGNDAFGLGQESFHPTAYGHELLEQAIMRQTNNLTAVSQSLPQLISSPTAEPSNPLLQVPSSGRATSNTSFQKVISGKASRGSSQTISVNGQAAGLKASTEYKVIVGDTPANSVTTDNTGDIAATITVPHGAPVGNQPLVITGPGQGSIPVTIIDDVYIPVMPDDSDGDGTTDATDPCPLVFGGSDSCDIPTTTMPADQTTPSIPTTSQAPTSTTTPSMASPQPATTANWNLTNLTFGKRVTPVTQLRLSASKVTGVNNISNKASSILGAVVKPSTRLKPTQRTDLQTFYWYIWLGIFLIACIVAGGQGNRRRKR